MQLDDTPLQKLEGHSPKGTIERVSLLLKRLFKHTEYARTPSTEYYYTDNYDNDFALLITHLEGVDEEGDVVILFDPDGGAAMAMERNFYISKPDEYLVIARFVI
jgi:hypothetical protein